MNLKRITITSFKLALALAPIHFVLYFIISLKIIGPFYYEENYNIILAITYFLYFLLFFLVYFLIGFFLNRIFDKINRPIWLYFFVFIILVVAIETITGFYVFSHTKEDVLMQIFPIIFSHLFFILTIFLPVSFCMALPGIFAGHNIKKFLKNN